jgi:hypothetical protein
MKRRQVTVFQSVEAGTKIEDFCGLDKSCTSGIANALNLPGTLSQDGF